MNHLEQTAGHLDMSPSPESVSLGTTLRNAQPLLIEPGPSGLRELYDRMTPVRALIPEIERYRLDSKEGNLEFPRTAAALANLGIMLRACDALSSMHSSGTNTQDYAIASERLHLEYNRFTAPQGESQKLSLKDFIALSEMYLPAARDEEALATVALGIVYGDLFKMPDIKQIMKERIQKSEVSDHDIALKDAFSEANLALLKDVFPTYFNLSEVARSRINTEVISGINLGHVLQMETCAVALSGLREVVSRDPDGARFWLLPTLMDISAARATSNNPNSWAGSSLFNNALTPALLTFAAQLPRLGEMGEAKFFDTFQETLAQRPFYRAIFSDPDLSNEQKQVVFRLARYFSWETDSREVAPLIAAYKNLGEDERNVLRNYFMASGMSPEDSKVVVTYLPYVFTQLYAKHFPLEQALSRSLESICGLLQVINDSKDNTHGHGMRVYAGQNLWFSDLRELGKEQLEGGPLTFEVITKEHGMPEVRLTK